MQVNRSLAIAFTVAVAAAAASFGATAPQGQAEPHKDMPAVLAQQAKISLEVARATALAKVPGGTVKSEELEREHGKLIYSFDVALPGKSGVEEINVSAITGKVLSRKHESARAEKREKREKQVTPRSSKP
jgi:uncharacterized membrane protein YkoI